MVLDDIFTAMNEVPAFKAYPDLALITWTEFLGGSRKRSDLSARKRIFCAN